MKRKTKKWLKRHFNLYNIAILGIVIIIIVSLIIIFSINMVNKSKTNLEEKELNGVKVVASNIKDDKEISEQDAKKMAVKQFKRLGEKIEEDELKITPIKRSGEKYYYITSNENTLEIKILGGEITRINSKIVE